MVVSRGARRAAPRASPISSRTCSSRRDAGARQLGGLPPRAIPRVSPAGVGRDVPRRRGGASVPRGLERTARHARGAPRREPRRTANVGATRVRERRVARSGETSSLPYRADPSRVGGRLSGTALAHRDARPPHGRAPHNIRHPVPTAGVRSSGEHSGSCSLRATARGTRTSPAGESPSRRRLGRWPARLRGSVATNPLCHRSPRGHLATREHR